MSILSFYRELLASVNVYPDDADQLTLRMPGEDDDETVDIALTCKKRRVMLPTPVNLNNGDWERQIVFHPLSELTHRNESDMMQRLRALYLTRLQTVFAELLLQLTQICANKDGHSELSPKASAVLSTMPQADQKTVAAVEAIIKASSFTGERKMLNLYTRRPGRIGASEYTRASYLSVPLLEALKDEDFNGSVFGTAKLRVKDRNGLIALIEYILPDLEIQATYARGSRSAVAPTFDSASRNFIAVANRFNTVVKTFKKYIANHKDLLIDTDWELHLDKLIEYDAVIPPQEGNIGSSATERDEPRPAAAVAAPTIGNSIIDAITPNPSKPTSKPATVTVEELAQRLAQQNQPAQAGWGAQPAQGGWGQPAVSATWGQNPAQVAASSQGGSTGADILNSMLARNGQPPAEHQFVAAGYGVTPPQPVNPRAGYNGIVGAVPIPQPQPQYNVGYGQPMGYGQPAPYGQPMGYGNGSPV